MPLSLREIPLVLATDLLISRSASPHRILSIVMWEHLFFMFGTKQQNFFDNYSATLNTQDDGTLLFVGQWPGVHYNISTFSCYEICRHVVSVRQSAILTKCRVRLKPVLYNRKFSWAKKWCFKIKAHRKNNVQQQRMDPFRPLHGETSKFSWCDVNILHMWSRGLK